MKRLYDSTFENLLKHSYHFFSNNFSGSIIAKSKRFVKQFETFTDILSFQIWFSIVILIGVLFIFFFKSPLLAYIFLGWSVLYILITFLFIRKKIYYDTQEAAADSLVTARLSDAILNILNIKIFSSDKKEEKSFAIVTADEENKRRKAWYFGNFQNLVQAAMMAILQVVVLFVSIRLWYLGELSLGTLTILQVYLLNLLNVLWGLGRSLTKAINALTDMKEVIAIFDSPIDILDSQKPESLKIKHGHIIFNNVSFSYKGGNMVLKNFNLDIIYFYFYFLSQHQENV